MIKRWISRAGRGLSLSGAAALFAALLPGCGPDCYVEATATITIDQAVTVTAGRRLVINSVSEVEDGDVTGADERGVPIGPAVDREEGAVEQLVENVRNYTIEVQTSPYPTWYYAFIDNDKDGKPSVDEPLGVAKGNPTDSGCESTAISIAIMPPPSP
jgi:hypothetical protein